MPRCAVATAEMNRFLPVVTEFLPSAREGGPQSRRCSTDSAPMGRLAIRATIHDIDRKFA